MKSIYEFYLNHVIKKPVVGSLVSIGSGGTAMASTTVSSSINWIEFATKVGGLLAVLLGIGTAIGMYIYNRRQKLIEIRKSEVELKIAEMRLQKEQLSK